MNEERQYRAEIGHRMDCPDDYMFGLSVWKARAKHDRTDYYKEFLVVLTGSLWPDGEMKTVIKKFLAEQEDTDE